MAKILEAGDYNPDSDCLHCILGGAVGGAVEDLPTPPHARDVLRALMQVAGDVILACPAEARTRLYAEAAQALGDRAGVMVVATRRSLDEILPRQVH